MIIYDVGRGIVSKATNAVAVVFGVNKDQIYKNKTLKKSLTPKQMKEHIMYNMWSSQYDIVKKLLIIHGEIKKEELTNQNKYEIFEGEIEVILHELENFANERYNLKIDTSINAIKDRRNLWSIKVLEQNNLRPEENA